MTTSALKPPLKDSLFLGDMNSLITNPTWIMFFQTVAATTPSSGGVGATGNLRLMGVWTAGVTYQVNDIVKGYEEYYYLCVSTHTAASIDEPGVGLGWSSRWDQFGGGALQRKYYTERKLNALTIPSISAVLSTIAESKVSNNNSLTALDVPSISYDVSVETSTSGVNFCVGGTASASSEYSGYPASDAFSSSNFWASSAIETYPHWIKYDLGSGNTKIAQQYKLTARNPSYNPSSAWLFQGSNDDSSWTDIDSQSSISWSSGETKAFDSFINSTGYRYYRFYFTASGSASNIAEMAYIEIME